MHVRREGDAGAPEVLLLHGAGVAGWMWRAVAERLPGRRVVVPDLPGHGASAADPFRGTDATVEAVSGLITRSAVVVGFSYGGQLAVQLAARFPERVAGVVVISALARGSGWAAVTDPVLRAALPLARNPRFARLQGRSLGVPEASMDDYVATSVGADLSSIASIVAANNRFAIPPGWAGFPGRALLAHGTSEPRAVAASARALQQALPAARLVAVAGARHDIPFRVPGWLADEIEALAPEAARVGAGARPQRRMIRRSIAAATAPARVSTPSLA